MGIEFKVSTLFASPLLQLDDIRWYGRGLRPTPECVSERAEITFQRRGMFVKRRGRRGVPCDPNTLLFINPGEAYALSHPVELECACTALLIDARVLAEIIELRAGSAARRRQGRFTFEQYPSCADFTLAHCKLVALTQANGMADPLTIEETGLHLAGRVISAACRNQSGRAPRLRPDTARAHADAAYGVRQYLAAHFRERLTLSQVARYVHCAPTHLCTLFKRHTGLSIHRYLNRLRLAAAIDRLADCRDLTALALELGFSNHSHFSTVFRREFGLTPSRLRRMIKPVTPRQLRKNLKV